MLSSAYPRHHRYPNMLSLHCCNLEFLTMLQQVTHGAIQFTAYEELRKVVVDFRSEQSDENSSADLLVGFSNQGFFKTNQLEYACIYKKVTYISFNAHCKIASDWMVNLHPQIMLLMFLVRFFVLDT